MKYCSNCGSSKLEFKIPEHDNLKRYCCSDCGTIFYTNPNMVVGALCIRNKKILMAKRNINPRKGLWTLPAGFMENAETLQDGALRETIEETISIAENEAASTSIDWTSSNKYYYDCSSSISFSFSNTNTNVRVLNLRVISGSGCGISSFPAEIKWEKAYDTSLLSSLSDGSTYIFSFFYDGSTYYGMEPLEFQ